jgi:hypothetical protein
MDTSSRTESKKLTITKEDMDDQETRRLLDEIVVVDMHDVRYDRRMKARWWKSFTSNGLESGRDERG